MPVSAVRFGFQRIASEMGITLYDLAVARFNIVSVYLYEQENRIAIDYNSLLFQVPHIVLIKEVTAIINSNERKFTSVTRDLKV